MRALLLDAGDGQAAISAARALDAAGWEVGIGAPGPTPLRRSRAVQWSHQVPWPATGAEGALAAVDAAVRLRGYAVVLPCGDDWVALLDGSGDGADRAWRSPYRMPGTARRCLDKLEVARAATAVGLRTPHTVAADAAAIAAWQGPVVVKARSHWLPDDDDPRHRLEARLLQDPADARPFAAAAAAAGGEAVLQEPVRGDLGGVVGLVHDGRFVRVAQQRADLVWPQPTGVTARATTCPLDADLVERAAALVGELGHEGLVQVEVLHPHDGSNPLVIDINPRCYGSLALAEAAGLGLTAAWARWAVTGERPTPRAAAVATRYVWTEGALRATRATRSAPLARVLRDAATATHPTWDVRDPVPALTLAGRLAGRAVRALARGASS